MQYDTDLTRDEIDRAVDAIEPAWTVQSASAVDAGHHAVYRLAVGTADGQSDCYLKATPRGKDPSVDLEARVLAVLEAHTDVPVPEVIGAVDAHDDLPAPFVLMGALPGAATHRTELPSLPDDHLRALARDTGRHLAELHALDAVGAYGFLARADPDLVGGRTSGDLVTIAVADPIADWRDRLHDWADTALEKAAATRFADVVPEAEPVIHSRVDAVTGPFQPCLARIDQALGNVLREGDRLRGMIDWEFTIAATPAYDLVHVARSLAGGPYLYAPVVPDRRELVLTSLLSGYRRRCSATVVERVADNRACYELLSSLRSMHHLADWYELFDLDGEIDDAAAALRADVRRRL